MKFLTRWLNRDDSDWVFDIFFLFLWTAPVIAAILWGWAWLLLYIIPVLMVGFI